MCKYTFRDKSFHSICKVELYSNKGIYLILVKLNNPLHVQPMQMYKAQLSVDAKVCNTHPQIFYLKILK